MTEPREQDREATFAEVFLHMFTPHVVQSFQLGHLIAIQRESVICEVREALVKYVTPEREKHKLTLLALQLSKEANGHNEMLLGAERERARREREVRKELVTVFKQSRFCVCNPDAHVCNMQAPLAAAEALDKEKKDA